MNRTNYENIVKKFINECAELSRKKSKDYADQDVLSNFKRMSAIGKLYKIDFAKPYESALFMLLMKLDRIQNILKGNKIPANEGIKDSIQDAYNYLMLMNGCIVEGCIKEEQ